MWITKPEKRRNKSNGNRPAMGKYFLKKIRRTKPPLSSGNVEYKMLPRECRPKSNSPVVTTSISSPLSSLDNSAIEDFTCATPKSFSNATSASALLPRFHTMVKCKSFLSSYD